MSTPNNDGADERSLVARRTRRLDERSQRLRAGDGVQPPVRAVENANLIEVLLPDPAVASEGAIESVTDLLIVALARREAARDDWPDRQDDRFLAWLGDDQAADRTDQELWSDDDVRRIAQQLEGRLRAARAPVRQIEAPVALRVATIVGTASQVLDDAAIEGCAPFLDLAAAAGSGRALWDEECEQWVVLPASLSPGRYLALGVAGASMTPLIHTGDIVLVRLGPEVARDAVIVARLPDGGYVVKQVARCTRASLELRSLNAAFPPIRVPRTRNAVLGTVVMCWRRRH